MASRTKYITGTDGTKYEIDFYCYIDDGKIEYSVKSDYGCSYTIVWGFVLP